MKSFILLILWSSAASTMAGDWSKDVLSPSSRFAGGWSISNVSMGVGWRSAGSLSYRGSSRSATVPFGSFIGGNELTVPPVGSDKAFADRAYRDGFVNQDLTTSENGDTWYWGYESTAQVMGDQLLFQAEGSRSDYRDGSDFSGDVRGRETLTGIAPSFDLILAPPGGMKFPLEAFLLSFSHFGDESSRQFTNFRARQDRDTFRLDYTDRYDISQIQPLIGDRYAGVLEGPGPLLSNLPLGREINEVLVNSDEAVIFNQIGTSLNLDAFSLAFGPTFQGSLNSHWSWQASGGVTLNLFDWNARETETLNVSVNGGPPEAFQRWQAKNSGTDFRLGAYLRGEVIYQLHGKWFAKAMMQAEIADDIRMTVGDSHYEFKPRGYSVGFSMGRSF